MISRLAILLTRLVALVALTGVLFVLLASVGIVVLRSLGIGPLPTTASTIAQRMAGDNDSRLVEGGIALIAYISAVIIAAYIVREWHHAKS